MAVIAPAFTTVNPSFTEPGFFLPYSQASGAFELLYGGEIQIKLNEGDLFVYAKRVDVRTRAAAGSAAYNQLPTSQIEFSQFITPTYLLRSRSVWDHHDAAAVSRWGASIVDVNRYAARQAHFQLSRNALIYGFNPQNGEGLLNTNGATTVSLPADSNGNTTIATYDNGQLATFLLSQIAAIKSRTNQMGIKQKFTILMPQRIGAQITMPNIVQLVQFQRTGAGSATTAGVVTQVLEDNGDEILWVYDDTLQLKGSGGTTDAIIITMRERKKPQGMRQNTNEFANMAPGNEACVLQYGDMPAPREITSQLPGGGIDVLSEWRITSGWAVIPESVSIISAQYQ